MLLMNLPIEIFHEILEFSVCSWPCRSWGEPKEWSQVLLLRLVNSKFDLAVRRAVFGKRLKPFDIPRSHVPHLQSDKISKLLCQFFTADLGWNSCPLVSNISQTADVMHNIRSPTTTHSWIEREAVLKGYRTTLCIMSSLVRGPEDIENLLRGNNASPGKQICAVPESQFVIKLPISTSELGRLGNGISTIEYLTESHLYENAKAGAAYLGDEDMLKALMKLDAGVSTDTVFFGMPLYWATRLGHQAMTRFLLEVGADPSDRDGLVFVQPSVKGDIEIVKLLLEAPQKHVPAQGYLQAFCSAIESGSIDLVHELHKVIDEAQFLETWSAEAIGNASSHGHLPIVEFLLHLGVDPNATEGPLAYPALYLASREGHAEVVELLLSWGSHVNSYMISQYGGTALQAAAEYGHGRILELLIQHGAHLTPPNGHSPLLLAARANLHFYCTPSGTKLSGPNSSSHNGDFQDVIKRLLAHGVSINAFDPLNSSTALAEAAYRGNFEMVRFLLQRGADPSLHMCAVTPLWSAAAGGHVELVRLFLELGIEIDGPPGSGHWDPKSTAMNIATQLGHDQVIKLLQEWGAKPADEKY